MDNLGHKAHLINPRKKHSSTQCPWTKPLSKVTTAAFCAANLRLSFLWSGLLHLWCSQAQSGNLTPVQEGAPVVWIRYRTASLVWEMLLVLAKHSSFLSQRRVCGASALNARKLLWTGLSGSDWCASTHGGHMAVESHSLSHHYHLTTHTVTKTVTHFLSISSKYTFYMLTLLK